MSTTIIQHEPLRVHRARRGWSQRDLAEHIGIHAQTIGAIEARGSASPLAAYAIATALGVDKSEISEFRR